MTNLHWYLAGPDLILDVVDASAWLAVGLLVGTFHFRTLRWNIRMIAAGRSLALALATQLIRFALSVSVLAVIASRFGAFSLLAAAAGILAARTAVVRRGVRP